ncbi:hypothetical protein E5F05_17070 [Deinococcus metallilatus]|uniref:Uncharacterized protein n=1 Tax=Deinococcus metallilatus TaxID=1211322 RepID=A0AAJ5JYZ6_9DEIO|nr:hypothetical protein [Deinococcus metallilatus]MBB5294777.1 hypothetical protein [Deinococcus metallilatus]QBY09499.1 hypothetical protein E5F05_17070 [Deinococcus metallilatus]RXJ09504.1 hypothetical protein ERJ73_15910 [Deinococcus metallilatus]TLK29026.1 hypothetical protein FCS05_07675 [Deinococcus metallilatus]GMA16703.1 hypothetical protein GCM10025871_30340 [Deinococcus metallilatus]
MASRVTTLYMAARTGSRVVRYLIRPAAHHAGVSRDPWSLPGRPHLPVRRGASLARRALGLVVLLVLSVLGAVLLVPLLVLLGIGTASGYAAAGWLLGFTLLLAALGAIWTFRRASRLITAPEEAVPGPLDAATGDDETGLLALLRAGERALPASARSALHATVIATRDALRATAGDLSLGRDAYDVRQAAREDLPELLRSYRAAPRSPETDRLLLGQLGLIGRRMQGITRERQQQQARALEAQRRYLESKYGEEGS